MLLATLGMLTIVGLMAAILSKRVAPLVALIALPVLASLCAGFGLQTGRFMLTGIEAIAGVIGMFVFAIADDPSLAGAHIFSLDLSSRN